ncbi:MAG: DUF1573 domain-containing protein [Planctomycetaceae bacterium]|nr:MAG: DUF1573 domain-containing protein [Planctomycetaceae bacterium]
MANCSFQKTTPILRWMALVVACAVVGWSLRGFLLVSLVGHEGTTQVGIIEHDMGNLVAGTKVRATVLLPNTTKIPLRIKSVRRDCACGVQQVTRDFIAPGERAELEVEYAVPAIVGSVRHELLVEYEQEVPPTFVLIKGTVHQWANVAPDHVDFSTVLVGEQPEIEVSIRTKEVWPRSERTAKIQLDYASIVGEEASTCGTHLTYRLRFAPPATAEHKRYHGEFLVRWDENEGRVVRVPCVAVLEWRYAAEPRDVFFGVVPSGATHRIGVQLRENKRDRSALDLSALRVRHDLPPSFYVGPLVTAQKDVLTLDVGIDISDPCFTGLIGGRVEILHADDQIICSFPVSAFIK